MNHSPEAAAQSPGRKRSSGVVIPNAPRWYQRLAAWVMFAAIRVVGGTLRVRWEDRSQLLDDSKRLPAIYCVWHNRLILTPKAYDAYVRRRDPTATVAAMVSASKDGGFLAAVLECFGMVPVRGSSSRRGPQALLELTTWAERGHDLAITPDGPRGPCYSVQHGVMSLAQITGMPIVPFCSNLSWKLRVKSWDRFQIPLPFSRCEMVLGPAIRVPREATDDEREALRQQLEQVMREMVKD